MQLLPSTARETARNLGYRRFTSEDLEDPGTNVRFGAYYYSRLLKDFNNNEILALAAYNAGQGKVQRWHRNDPRLGTEIASIPYRETRDYVIRVQRTYKWLKKIQRIRYLLHPKKA
jgi:soluble lytic murein transglycosylase